jgi:hypothetical protein
MSAIVNVMAERDRQDAKWGQQNHRDGTGHNYERARESYRNACQAAFAEDVGTWADVWLEEVFEALAETNPYKLREELIQAAAVAVAWVEAIDRRLEVTA